MEKKKAVLVTGAVRNTGLAIAEKFLAEGCTVFITSRDKDSATNKAAELKGKYGVECFGLQYEPSDAKNVCETMFSEISEKGYIIDKLVCAHADSGLNQDTLQVELEEWEKVILTNVMGSYIPARYMVKNLIASRYHDGTVVFLGSIVGSTAIPGRSSYVASKGALTSMTKALAVDFANYGVRVNCVAAGPIRTERWDVLSEEAAQNIGGIIPIGGPVSGMQIANTVWFLSSDVSSGITGSSIAVDGGLESVIPGAY